jgi:hypothetical protein
VNVAQVSFDFGKPVHITEFGCATYEGAFQLGGAAYRSSGGYDEDAQAVGIRRYLEVINQCGVDGCFLHQFRGGGTYVSSRFSIVEDAHRKKAFYVYKSYQN